MKIKVSTKSDNVFLEDVKRREINRLRSAYQSSPGIDKKSLAIKTKSILQFVIKNWEEITNKS